MFTQKKTMKSLNKVVLCPSGMFTTETGFSLRPFSR
jgi:hypothetical protein